MKALGAVLVLALVAAPSPILSQEPGCTTVVVMGFTTGLGSDSLAQLLPQALVSAQPEQPVVCWQLAGRRLTAAGTATSMEAPYTLMGSVLASDTIRVDWRLIPTTSSGPDFGDWVRIPAEKSEGELAAELADVITASVAEYVLSHGSPPPPRQEGVPAPPTLEYLSEAIATAGAGAFEYPRDSAHVGQVGRDGFFVWVEHFETRTDTLRQNYGYGATVSQAADQCLMQETLPTENTTTAADGGVQMACGIATRRRIRQCEQANGTWRAWDEGFLCERRVRLVGAFVFDYASAEKKWVLSIFKTGGGSGRSSPNR